MKNFLYFNRNFNNKNNMMIINKNINKKIKRFKIYRMNQQKINKKLL